MSDIHRLSYMWFNDLACDHVVHHVRATVELVHVRTSVWLVLGMHTQVLACCASYKLVKMIRSYPNKSSVVICTWMSTRMFMVSTNVGQATNPCLSFFCPSWNPEAKLEWIKVSFFLFTILWFIPFQDDWTEKKTSMSRNRSIRYWRRQKQHIRMFTKEVKQALQ